jgi:hypothetical protein
MVHEDVEDISLDLKTRYLPRRNECTSVYNLAADMGGMGFIELNKAACMPAF